MEVRDRVIEASPATSMSEYPVFLQHMLPPMERLLQSIPPQTSAGPEHRIRYVFSKETGLFGGNECEYYFGCSC